MKVKQACCKALGKFTVCYYVDFFSFFNLCTLTLIGYHRGNTSECVNIYNHINPCSPVNLTEKGGNITQIATEFFLLPCISKVPLTPY